MSSRREEERNEKIIRGLMKLPPNRRCINCNSLGPQYVCTNFWTFVCTTCSGIHREFTHRVKSVSMAKFTFQEVEALQNGGNQRAREIFLKDWDSHRQRLPDSSNVGKVREFIKDVYVDRRYANGKNSQKPPRDIHNPRNHEDETRRASSYHSYSQSPPYDYQYEERRYGKQAPVLTRKPGSDRGLYEGKVSSFFSPNRLSDQRFEDTFANEGSNSRVSDYSVSSGGDPVRSNTQSPNFQRGTGFSSPSSETSRDFSNEHTRNHSLSTFSDTSNKKFEDHVAHPQRTASLGSFGSFDSNSMSFKSVNSVTSMDVTAEPKQNMGCQENKLATVSLPQSTSGNFAGLDLFNTPCASQTATATTSSVNVFQPPETSSMPLVDLFQLSSLSSVAISDSNQPFQSSSPSSLDLFSEMHKQMTVAALNEKSPSTVTIENDGWATFDVPQHKAPDPGLENSTSVSMPSASGDNLRKFDPLVSLDTNLQWSAFQDSVDHVPSSSMLNPWHNTLHDVEPSHDTLLNTQQFYSASENFVGGPLHQSLQTTEKVAAHYPSSMEDHHVESGAYTVFSKEGIQTTASDPGFPIPSIRSNEGVHSHPANSKSTNPFDLPDDCDMVSNNVFLDMSCLQAVLPNDQMPTSFVGGMTQPWFPQDPVTPYMTAAPQGGIGFMAGQGPSNQIPNVPAAQGPVASVGGNPFA